jgi:hypothetical protein
VGFEVFGEVRDALGEQGDLNLGRARVGLVCTELVDELRFFFGMKRHLLETPERKGIPQGGTNPILPNHPKKPLICTPLKGVNWREEPRLGAGAL